MIAGEGTVFALILGLGIYRTRNTFKKEFELSKQQKNFMLSITHELKSPIASARLQIETLLKRQLPHEKQEFVLNQALQETERLDALVEKILLANRIESSAYLIQKEHFNLSELCQKIINNLKGSLLKNNTINSQITKDITVFGDEMAFTSIINNLLDNASKYSAPQSSIELVLSNEGDFITLVVKDQGIGILTSEEGKVFNKFYRAGNEETRNTKGTGLGLYIVKNLVNMHQGNIKITSNQPKGTIFTIQLNSTNNA
jgi:signal transduction histidine kinase